MSVLRGHAYIYMLEPPRSSIVVFFLFSNYKAIMDTVGLVFTVSCPHPWLCIPSALPNLPGPHAPDGTPGGDQYQLLCSDCCAAVPLTGDDH